MVGQVRRTTAGAVAAVACCAVLGGAVPARAAVSAPAASWGSPTAVGGLSSGSATALDCAAPGDCALAATVGGEAYVAREAGGSWGTAAEIPALAAADAGRSDSINALWCGSPGNCEAVGYYTAGRNQVPFTLRQAGGTWGGPQRVAGVSTGAVTFLSCPRPGDCTAGGAGFVVTESNGTWGSAHQIRGVSIESVACGAPGDCAAGGQDGSQGFVVTENDGRWGAVATEPGLAFVSQVACPAAGGCVAVGESSSAATYTLNQSSGGWGKPAIVPGLVKLAAGNGYPQPGLTAPQPAVTCGAVGRCSVFGDYWSPQGDTEQAIFVSDSASGRWGQAYQLPGTGTSEDGGYGGVLVASCWAAGYCSAGGEFGYKDLAGPFVTDQAAGAWTGASVPFENGSYSGAIGLLSCAPGFCAAVVPTDGGVLVAQATEPVPQPTSTGQALSASSVTYGHENTVQVRVGVAAQSGVPGGVVTVNAGNTAVCRITLKSGRGSCTLAARQLKPGAYHLVAVYGGAAAYLRSVSAHARLSVLG